MTASRSGTAPTTTPDPVTVFVRPVELRAGDRLIVGRERREVMARPFPTMVDGKVRLRVELDHRGSHSWPMDHASRFAGAEIVARTDHGRRVA